MQTGRMMAIAAAAGMMVTTGCMIERPYDTSPNVDRLPDNRAINDEYRVFKRAEDGRISGNIGPVSADDTPAFRQNVYDDGYYLSVETTVTFPDRAAMTLLSVSNGADVFQPGLNATFNLDNDYAADSVQVSLLGCVGQEIDVYDEYDMPADQVAVSVEDGPSDDSVDVALTSRWHDRDDNGFATDTFREAHTSFTLFR